MRKYLEYKSIKGDKVKTNKLELFTDH
jgi:hypothetical protein